MSTLASDITDFISSTALRIQTTLNKPFTPGSQLYSVTTSTTTGTSLGIDSPQPPYQVKLWVSIGREPTSSDTPRDIEFVFLPNQGQVITTELETQFRLPTRFNSNPSQELEPSLSLSDLIGETLYVRLCLERTNFTPICLVDTFPIFPEQPRFFESSPSTSSTQPTLYWEQLPRLNNVPLGDGHRITFTNQNNGAIEGSEYVSALNGPPLVLFNGELRNRLILRANRPNGVGLPFSPTAGVGYTATLQACGQERNVCGESKIIRDVTALSTSFTASEGTDEDAVNVDWVPHSSGALRYLLRRCVTNNPRSCKEILSNSNATDYRDTTAEPGVRYRYTVFVCRKTACSDRLATGTTNSGFRARSTPEPVDDIDASDGTELNRIDVTWSEFAPDASSFTNPGYIVEARNLALGSDPVVRGIEHQPNQAFTMFRTGIGTGLLPGVLYEFSVRSCANYKVSPDCPVFSPVDTGFAFARFDSGSPSAGVAQINWTSFSQDTLRYRLERCKDSPNAACEFINVGNVTTYQDTGLTPGESYDYSVFACGVPQYSGCVKIGDTDVVEIVGNVRPDRFEDDDSPALLTRPIHTIAESSATQTRSFDTADDQDWTRITFGSGVREFDIRTESNFNNFDSQLTLFDARGRIVACALNNANEATGDARLRIANLPAGEYFLRVEQQDTGLILEPIASYTLRTTINFNSTGPTLEFPDCSGLAAFPEKGFIVSPILQLLLSD